MCVYNFNLISVINKSVSASEKWASENRNARLVFVHFVLATQVECSLFSFENLRYWYEMNVGSFCIRFLLSCSCENNFFFGAILCEQTCHTRQYRKIERDLNWLTHHHDRDVMFLLVLFRIRSLHYNPLLAFPFSCS